METMIRHGEALNEQVTMTGIDAIMAGMDAEQYREISRSVNSMMADIGEFIDTQSPFVESMDRTCYE